MIQQTAKGLNSRSEANPYNEDGFLPLKYDTKMTMKIWIFTENVVSLHKI